MTDHDAVVEQARRALLGDDRDPEQVKVEQANREVLRVSVEQIRISDSELSMLKAAGLDAEQANAIRDYARTIASRHSIAGAMGVKEATEYARRLLDWAKGYALEASKVRGSSMVKAYQYIMRHL